MKRCCCVVLLMLIAASLAPAAETLAFPGAQGYGRFASGGRGGRVIRVTTTADEGPGSLREALEATGPRIVVFATGGLCTLSRPIVISHGDLSVFAQTAPEDSDGFCVRGARIQIAASNVIIIGLRVRTGDRPGHPDRNELDGISIGTPKQRVGSIMLAHCSLTWASDQNLALWSNTGVHDVSIQQCIIAEALGGPDRTESLGLVIGDNSERVTVVGNYFASNRHCNPQIHRAEAVEILGNLIHGWAISPLTMQKPSTAHIIGNRLRSVPGFSNVERLGIYLMAPGPGHYFLHGNIGPGREQNRGAEIASAFGPGLAHVTSNLVFPPSGAGIGPAELLDETMLPRVGACWPRRDATDQRILAMGSAGRAHILGSVDELGGFPSYAPGTPPVDTDNDGMPDDWERAQGLDPLINDAIADRGSEGYDPIEIYAHSRMHAGQVARRVALANTPGPSLHWIHLRNDGSTAISGISLQSIAPDKAPGPDQDQEATVLTVSYPDGLRTGAADRLGFDPGPGSASYALTVSFADGQRLHGRFLRAPQVLLLGD